MTSNDRPGSRSRRACGAMALALAACGGAPAARAPGGATAFHQIWDVTADADGCVAYMLCYGELSAPCDPAPPAAEQIVAGVPYACLPGRSKAQLGQRRDTRACVLLPEGTEEVPCPQASPMAWYPGEGEPAEAEPESSGVELSVSARRNVEKGQEALARHDVAAARAYFEFTLTRYPQSSFVHEAERGLLGVALAEARAPAGDLAQATCLFVEHHPSAPQVVSGELTCPAGTKRSPSVHADELAALDAEAARAKAAGEIDADSTNGYCAFIAHHPAFPQVVSGDVACRINTLQGDPCDPTQTTAPRHCASP